MLSKSLLAAVVIVSAVTESRAADINVHIDQARVIKLSKPGAGVIVGNPSIADVSVQNERLLVVTGKSFGVTNIIVLDAQNRKILSKRVSVGQDTRRIVTVTKGPYQFTYSCKPTCRPALLPGDSQKHFEMVERGTRGKLTISQSVVEGTQTPQ